MSKLKGGIGDNEDLGSSGSTGDKPPQPDTTSPISTPPPITGSPNKKG